MCVFEIREKKRIMKGVEKASVIEKRSVARSSFAFMKKGSISFLFHLLSFYCHLHLFCLHQVSVSLPCFSTSLTSLLLVCVALSLSVCLSLAERTQSQGQAIKRQTTNYTLTR